MHSINRTVQNLLLLFFIAHCALFVSSCSLPSLEKPECSAARDAVKRFYSFHFANDMHPSADSLRASEEYLTDRLFSSLSASTEAKIDYFTQTDDYPRAFRVGTCSVEADDKALLQVLLFWRDETRTQQRAIKVEAVKIGDKWLVDKVSK
jgi:hypothetical protein